jgi:predicted dehydrogenase
MLLTTGCHSITYIYHLLGRPKPERVYAELVPDGARLEAAAYVTIRFSDGRVAWVDSSATHALGGFDDRAEIYGTRGTVFLDLYRSTGIKVFSQEGYGDIGQSAFALIPSETTNWSHPIVDERWSLGYEAELRHFLCCVRDDSDPSVTLDDGKLTLKIVLAAYEAGRTHKSVEMSEASTGR